MYRLEDDARVVRKRRDQGEVRDAPASDRPRPALAGKVDHAAELTGRGRVDVTFGADKCAARTPELVRRHPRLARPAQPARDVAAANSTQHVNARLFGKRREQPGDETDIPDLHR